MVLLQQLQATYTCRGVLCTACCRSMLKSAYALNTQSTTRMALFPIAQYTKSTTEREHWKLLLAANRTSLDWIVEQCGCVCIVRFVNVVLNFVIVGCRNFFCIHLQPGVLFYLSILRRHIKSLRNILTIASKVARFCDILVDIRSFIGNCGNFRVKSDKLGWKKTFYKKKSHFLFEGIDFWRKSLVFNVKEAVFNEE